MSTPNEPVSASAGRIRPGADGLLLVMVDCHHDGPRSYERRNGLMAIVTNADLTIYFVSPMSPSFSYKVPKGFKNPIAGVKDDGDVHQSRVPIRSIPETDSHAEVIARAIDSAAATPRNNDIDPAAGTKAQRRDNP